jgi:hypothetical protein
MGFSLLVLDETKQRESSEAYLRMTLTQLSAFLGALKAAPNEIALSAVESIGGSRMQGLALEQPGQRNGGGQADEHAASAPRDLKEGSEGEISIRELRSLARTGSARA